MTKQLDSDEIVRLIRKYIPVVLHNEMLGRLSVSPSLSMVVLNHCIGKTRLTENQAIENIKNALLLLKRSGSA